LGAVLLALGEFESWLGKNAAGGGGGACNFDGRGSEVVIADPPPRTEIPSRRAQGVSGVLLDNHALRPASDGVLPPQATEFSQRDTFLGDGFPLSGYLSTNEQNC
jgi:hypothetical protein